MAISANGEEDTTNTDGAGDEDAGDEVSNDSPARYHHGPAVTQAGCADTTKGATSLCGLTPFATSLLAYMRSWPFWMRPGMPLSLPLLHLETLANSLAQDIKMT